jgi:hypothetical protein
MGARANNTAVRWQTYVEGGREIALMSCGRSSFDFSNQTIGSTSSMPQTVPTKRLKRRKLHRSLDATYYVGRVSRMSEPLYPTKQPFESDSNARKLVHVT